MQQCTERSGTQAVKLMQWPSDVPPLLDVGYGDSSDFDCSLDLRTGSLQMSDGTLIAPTELYSALGRKGTGWGVMKQLHVLPEHVVCPAPVRQSS